ncbi:MAG: hypothetical protein HY774_05035 [Acidobacteria bacterium]|nr:hypothetical protein [Acidobacteriota bacterium]
MPDKALKILKESLPSRCDVCHQADQFDPVTGVCQRCQFVFGGNPESDSLAKTSYLACPKCGSLGKFFASVGFCYQCYEQTAVPVGNPVRYGPVVSRSGVWSTPKRKAKASIESIRDRTITLKPLYKKLAIGVLGLIVYGGLTGLINPVLVWIGFWVVLWILCSWDR